MNILPKPEEIVIKEGKFKIFPKTAIVLNTGDSTASFESAKLLQEEMKKDLGFKISITKSFNKDQKQAIYLNLSDLEKEAYQLTITPKQIRITGGDEAGLFYGVQTLRQIIRTEGRKLSCLVIKDKPYFAARGFYHDITRGKVPTLETLKQLADTAAFYKINQIQLYIEHTFAFKKQSEVWVQADPLSAEEIIEFDEYCKKLHIELIPSLSTFGHLYEALTTYSFHHLCELEHSLDEPYSWIGRMAHHTLDVSNPKSLEFVQEMLSEFVPLFSSDKFNICCDETFDLGKGKNKEKAEKLGKGRLYVDFLNKVVESVKSYGKKVMFWGDVIIGHPELLSKIPEDVICLNWNYNPKAWDKETKIFAESGRKQYVCPGVNGWNRFMNDIEGAFSNISRMVRYGKTYKAIGVLNTDWGDFGHINLFANSIPGMIYGAVLSWNPEDRDKLSTINKKIAQIQFNDPEGKLVELLRELAKQQLGSFNEIVWWQERDIVENLPQFSEEEAHKKYCRALEIKEELLTYLSLVSEENRLDLEEFCISATGIALFNSLYLNLKKYVKGQQVDQLIDTPNELAVKLEYWLQDFEAVWRSRNKESELFRIKDMIIKICHSLRNFK